MTDDQYQALMRAIRDLAVTVEAMRLKLNAIERKQDDRHRLIADWIGPEPEDDGASKH